MEIVLYRPELRDELQRFLDTAFPDSPRHRSDLWDWLHTDNPHADGPPAIWLLLDAGRVVGQLPTYQTRLRCAGRCHPVRVTYDFLVLPEYRNRGAGPLLVRALNGHPDTLLNLGPNRTAVSIFARMGWRTTCVLPRATRVISPLVAAAGRLGFNVWQGAAQLSAPGWPHQAPLAPRCPLGQLLRTLGDSPPRYELPPTAAIVALTDFDTAFDEFWNRWATDIPICLERDAPRMSWRFVRHPLPAYNRLAVRDAGGRLQAVLIFRVMCHKGVPTARIVELLGPPRWVEPLLRAALNDLANAGVAAIHTRVGHRDHRGLLQRAGFWVRSSESHVVRLMFRPDERLPWLLATRDANWLVSLGDGDADW